MVIRQVHMGELVINQKLSRKSVLKVLSHKAPLFNKYWLKTADMPDNINKKMSVCAWKFQQKVADTH